MLLLGAKEVCERRRSTHVAPADKFEKYSKPMDKAELYREELDEINKRYEEIIDPWMRHLHSLAEEKEEIRNRQIPMIKAKLNQAQKKQRAEQDDVRARYLGP